MFEGLFQPMHMLLVLVIAIIFFGPGKLPAIGKGLGRSIREFKKAMSDTDKSAIDASTGQKTGSNTQEIKKQGGI
jgi:sec-independent protein translocase protein TatA